MLRQRIELNDSHFIATFLSLLAYFLIYPPDKGMEPEYRLSQYLKYIDSGIEAGYMTELMCQESSVVLGIL